MVLQADDMTTNVTAKNLFVVFDQGKYEEFL